MRQSRTNGLRKDRMVAALILILVLLVGWLYLRHRQGQKTTPPAARRSSSGGTAYHSVSLRFSATACGAAKALEGRRFLASAAPRIPLPECDVKNCECRFAHYRDRRAAQDRRSIFTAFGQSAATRKAKWERRDARERREDDDPLA
jgi:hypothetical protein